MAGSASLPLGQIQLLALLAVNLAHLLHALLRLFGLLRRGFALDVFAREVLVRILPVGEVAPLSRGVSEMGEHLQHAFRGYAIALGGSERVVVVHDP